MKNRWGKLSDDWKDIDEIIIYGFGLAAEVVFEKIRKDVHVKFIIDNNLNSKEYQGIPIYTYSECKELIEDTKILVTAETIAGMEVAEQLKEEGFVENEDFALLERFVSEWYYKKFQKVVFLEIHSSITSRCTFNCKHCNIFIPYQKEKRDLKYENIISSIDSFFENVDYVFKFQLIGGEPILNKDLPKIIYYLGQKYKNKIGMIRVVTNGAVIPNQELLNQLKNNNCYVMVSNYTHIIPYKNIYDKVIDLLQKNKIRYRELIEQRWRNPGFPEKPNCYTTENCRTHMLTCLTFWHGLVDDKIYYCNCTWNAEKTGMFTASENDYFDLKKIKDETGKVELLKYVLGDMTPDFYNSFCCLCGGCGKDNQNFVISGEQMQ